VVTHVAAGSRARQELHDICIYLVEENMKIRTKLLLLAAASMVALAFIGIMAMVNTLSLGNDISRLSNVVVPSRAYLNHIKFANAEIERAITETAIFETDYSAYAREEFRNVAKRMDQGFADHDAARKSYLDIPRMPDVAEMLKPLREGYAKALGAWKTDVDSIRPLVDGLIALPPGDEEGQKALMAKIFEGFKKQVKPYSELDIAITALTQAEAKFAEEVGGAAERKVSSAIVTQSVVFAVSLILILFLCWSTFRAVMKPLTLTCATMERITQENNLTYRVDLDSKDEMGQLANSFNALVGRLHGTLSTASGNAGGVLSTSSVLTSAAAQVADSSAKQASATSATAAAVEEMTVSINTVSNSAEEAQNLALRAGENSEQGGKTIQEAVREMGEIASTVGEASKVINDLGQESREISNVVQVIREVADQTNLLALNAAIEAARAGEQGRGFAVVADEVRKLAERTAQSTGDISAMIGKIQGSANDAVAEMEKVVQRMEQGKALVESAGERMLSIQDDSSKVSAAVTEISNNLKEQSIASQDIAKHVESIARMTDENNVAAEKTSSNARQLDELAKETNVAIAVFKL
jgi:methyl-accepting chemotaxis protein